MGFLESILGRRSMPESEREFMSFSREIPYENDNEVITVDPNKPVENPGPRTPVIFSNGLK